MIITRWLAPLVQTCGLGALVDVLAATTFLALLALVVVMSVTWWRREGKLNFGRADGQENG